MQLNIFFWPNLINWDTYERSLQQSPMAPYISLGEKLKTLPDSVRYSTPAVPLHTHTHISDCGLCTIPCLLPHSNHWRREWQTTSEFLPWEPHEQHEKAKWQASLTRWTRVWVSSGSWWWTGRPGVLRFMGSQRVRHNWEAELNWTELKVIKKYDILWG